MKPGSYRFLFMYNPARDDWRLSVWPDIAFREMAAEVPLLCQSKFAWPARLTPVFSTYVRVKGVNQFLNKTKYNKYILDSYVRNVMSVNRAPRFRWYDTIHLVSKIFHNTLAWMLLLYFSSYTFDVPFHLWNRNWFIDEPFSSNRSTKKKRYNGVRL